MIAIKAHFDGERIVLPEELQGAAPRDVIVVFENASEKERQLWLKAQEPTFAKAWENDEDAVYDSL